MGAWLSEVCYWSDSGANEVEFVDGFWIVLMMVGVEGVDGMVRELFVFRVVESGGSLADETGGDEIGMTK
jgi:hypothetical protein